MCMYTQLEHLEVHIGDCVHIDRLNFKVKACVCTKGAFLFWTLVGTSY